MKRITVFILSLCLTAGLHAEGLSDDFSGNTLRLDYVFAGGTTPAAVALVRMSCTDEWFGRTVNMTDVPVQGNGEICLTDAATGTVLYRNSFSTLFQEWLTSAEAKTLTKAFENTFIVPMPAQKAVVSIRLFNTHNEAFCEYSSPVDPDDILIEHKATSKVQTKYIHRGGDSHGCIDVAIIAEGYTAAEMETFFRDAETAVGAIFSHEPFASRRDDFNFLAVAPVSEASGVSVPREGKWFSTPVASHFDTFYTDRYLTTERLFLVHDLLDGLPYEHIIILANTDVYGGGGIYNSYTLTTAHHPAFKPVVVHEFGHSFGALADEYDYASTEDPFYFPDVEPWEQNITTQADFASKWKDMVDEGVKGVGLFEGAGYQSKGVWRPVEDCRMRTNGAGAFCPVCRRAIDRIIMFNTKESDK